ncbi:unnamed protein product [Meganyctiphanes norvegica]|uniref:Uncharacterized protein n=1 Tax=Meganyctiphanes norvegica TaxID=48144 RepID=A0AAV2SS22_MEGNR
MSSMFDDQIVIGVLHDYTRDLGWMAGRNDVTLVRGKGLLAYIYDTFNFLNKYIYDTFNFLNKYSRKCNICRSVFGDERIVTSRYRLILEVDNDFFFNNTELCLKISYF